jgi:propanediol dehydratase small subunit
MEDNLKEDAVQHIERVKDIMKLTNEELLEMNKFLFEYRSANQDLLRLILESDMNSKQKMFLCYVRGTAQEFHNAKIRHNKKQVSKYINDVGAYEK